MTEPVTPDREALEQALCGAVVIIGPDGWIPLRPHEAAMAVDALLPLLTDALDRARQQGREDAAQAIEADPDLIAYYGGYSSVIERCADLARGADRKDEE